LANILLHAIEERLDRRAYERVLTKLRTCSCVTITGH
jgi:hypothetical protein